MFAIIGILVVFGAVTAGYLMEHGNLKVLMQPAELVIIGGAAIGTVLVANPLHILKKIAAGFGGVFGGSKFNRQRYLDTLKMMYGLLNKARKDGMVALEPDIEDPAKSPLFSKYPAFTKDHHVRDFVCDTMRMAISGGVEPFDLDQMMELDMDVHHHGATPAGAGAQHYGGFASRTGYRCGGARRCDHDGRAGRAAGRNRPQSCRGSGRNVSRNPPLLRFGWTHRGQHGQAVRR